MLLFCDPGTRDSGHRGLPPSRNRRPARQDRRGIFTRVNADTPAAPSPPTLTTISTGADDAAADGQQ
jgi:hypothetical protein